MSHDGYFEMVCYPTDTKGLARSFYRDPSPDAVKRFEWVNGLTDKKSIDPGTVIVVPSLEGGSENGVDGLRKTAERSNFLIGKGPAPHAQSFNGDFDIMEVLASSTSDAKVASKVLKGATRYLNEHVGGIEKDLNKLADAYKKAQSSGWKLNSPAAKALRAPIETSLQKRIPGFARDAILKNGSKASMKDALGISHRSLDKAFRTTGSPADVKPVSDALKRTAGFTKHLKAADKVAKVLSVGSATVDVISKLQAEGASSDSFHHMARKAGGLAGGMSAGTFGATAGASAATAALVAFGVGTGGLGIVAIGIGAAAGGLLFGSAGTWAAEQAVDQSIVKINDATEAAIDWYFKNSAN